MKKFLSVLLVATLLTLSMAGCGLKITIEKDEDTPDIIGSIKEKAKDIFGKEDEPEPVDDPVPEEDEPDNTEQIYVMDNDDVSEYFDLVFGAMRSAFCDSILLKRYEIESDNLSTVYTSYPAMAGLLMVCRGISGQNSAPSSFIDNGYTEFSNGYDGMVAAGLCTAEDAIILDAGDMGDTLYEYIRLADLQPYLDCLYGTGRVDVTEWEDEIEGGEEYIAYYVTGTGYILYHTGIGDITFMLSSVTDITLDGPTADVTFKRICAYPWDGEVYDGYEIAGYTEADIEMLYDMDMADAYDEVLSQADFSEAELNDYTLNLFKDADGVHIYEASYVD